MITLCGMALSNYYNKVKLVLLEKRIAFDEELVATGSREESVLSASPLAKIPYIRTEHGTLCESEAIVQYLEDSYPQIPLMPRDAWERAKVRELTTFIDLHLELVVRELYPQAFFGGTVSEAVQASVRKRLTRHIAGFQRLAKFSPFVAGDTFTSADCAAYVSLPLVAMATKAVLGEDLLAAGGIDWKAYTKALADRPSVQRVNADRKACQEAQLAAMRAR
ncbi:glutathione S-transferase [Ideonella sp. 4Y11]|uniref:Glutathione S-transferase n=1 Tax=Ideonella aquatica TaxID=2824119 RepID=A0A940YGR9_9BURK|nr:glutathione S-transferase [Ideonella aquatica]MBQ0959109.1 glutathione S-transferase [Ideonella aquatica]